MPSPWTCLHQLGEGAQQVLEVGVPQAEVEVVEGRVLKMAITLTKVISTKVVKNLSPLSQWCTPGGKSPRYSRRESTSGEWKRLGGAGAFISASASICTSALNRRRACSCKDVRKEFC